MKPKTKTATRETCEYSLVQRLFERTDPWKDSVGFDRLFEMDYMGSAEFEFGATFKALRSIRADGPVQTAEFEFTISGQTRSVYMVGTGDLNAKWEDFLIWAHDPFRPFYAKENPRFLSAFTGVATFPPEAWWSLQDNVAWALDASIAAKLAEGFAPAAE